MEGFTYFSSLNPFPQLFSSPLKSVIPSSPLSRHHCVNILNFRTLPCFLEDFPTLFSSSWPISPSIILRDGNTTMTFKHPLAFPLSFKHLLALCGHGPVSPPNITVSAIALKVPSDCYLSPMVPVPSLTKPALYPHVNIQSYSLIK